MKVKDMDIEIFDAYKQKIRVGDIIAYGKRVGNSGEIELKEVIGFKKFKTKRFNSAYLSYGIEVKPYKKLKHINNLDATNNSIIKKSNQVCVVTNHFK